MRRHYLLLALIVALGAGLRIAGIGRESLWTDEALTLVLAYWPTGDMLLQPTDPTPFLYYWLHKLLVPAGAGIVAARSISLVAGLLSIVAIYALGRLAFGRRAGLLAAALLAVWAAHVDYSQEARAYSLLVLLTLVSAAGLLWWFRESGKVEPSRARYAALAVFAAATVLAFYTHLVAIFWIALALQIFVSGTQRKRPGHLPEMAAALAAMALLAVPGLIRLARDMATPDAFHWLPQASPAEFVATTAGLYLPLGLGGLAGTLVWLVVTAALVAPFVRARPEWPAAAVTFAFLALPLLLWLYGFVERPIFMERTILFAIPGMILLIAAAIGTLRSERVQQLAGTALVGLFLAATLLQGTTREKEDWRGANSALAARARPGDLILVCPGWKYPPFRHAAGPMPGPVIIRYAGTPLLLDSGEGWEESYFTSATEPLMRSWIGGTARAHLPDRIALAPGASVWLVASECAPEERAAFDRWLGAQGGWTEIWRSAAIPDQAAISVSRAPPRTPAALPVIR
jgi:mannosyltransferase